MDVKQSTNAVKKALGWK